jgi:hypothetical protein
MALLFAIAVLREFTRLAVATFLPIMVAMQGRSLLAGGLTLSLCGLSLWLPHHVALQREQAPLVSEVAGHEE